MITKLRTLTIADWDAMPYRDGNRYEIIEGELFVSCSPGLTHENVLFNLIVAIGKFLDENPVGVAVGNVGVILSNVSGVVPDLVFFRSDQHETIVKDDRLHGPPALVIEVLSPGSTNTRRDRISKLHLYDKHEVPEYWIVDPKNKTLEKYIRKSSSLILHETFQHENTLITSALPGFSCQMRYIFKDRT